MADNARPVLFPTEYPATRRLLVLLATVFAILSGYAQIALDIGQTPEEFSADSDATLKAAGWAFSIWGLIYAWLMVYAVYQVWPKTRESSALHRLGWPSFAALLGIGLWIYASAFDWEMMTIVLIVGSALALIIPLTSDRSTYDETSTRERFLVFWPLGLLAGWLTIASAVNIVTVLTGNGDLPAALSPTGWGVVTVLIVAAIALAVTARTRLLAYPIPIVWGLIGVFAAEQARHPATAFTAIGAAVLLAIAAVVLCFRLTRKSVGS